MADDDAAERASQEIKALCRRLNPNSGNHKDRIRRLNKFRNFVQGESTSDGGTPEFYDDDIPLLLLGSAAPAALLGDDPEFMEGDVMGLLQACGTPSVEHDQMLKRSARHAMSLLKFLVCDFVEDGQAAGASGSSPGGGGTKDSSLNLFAQAFCSLPITKYQYMSLDLHVVGDQRGGAKEDACHVMQLLLANHMAEDGETKVPMSKDDLLAQPSAQQSFEVWLTKHASREVQQTIKENEQLRLEQLDDPRENRDDQDDDLDDDSEGEEEEGDEITDVFRKRKNKAKKDTSAMDDGDLEENRGPALRWEDSQLYREQRARFAAHQKMQKEGEFHDTVRDSQEAAAELAEREEEKSKIMRKDPLGLKDDDFDLRTIENNQVDFLEQALLEVQEEIRKGEAGGEDQKALQQKKESLESILDNIAGVAASDGQIMETGRSTLPTEPHFDPLLFLTLVHRKASYEELVNSMDRLSSKWFSFWFSVYLCTILCFISYHLLSFFDLYFVRRH